MWLATRAMKQPAALVVLALLLTGCGFHLRGEDAPDLTLPELALRCSNQEAWHLCQTLRQTFAQKDVEVRSEAPIQFSVQSRQQHNRAIALSADADAAEYMVTLEFELELSHDSEQFESRRTTISASQAMKNRESAALQEQGESEALQRNLQRRLAEQALEWLNLQLDDLKLTGARVIN